MLTVLTNSLVSNHHINHRVSGEKSVDTIVELILASPELYTEPITLHGKPNLLVLKTNKALQAQLQDIAPTTYDLQKVRSTLIGLKRLVKRGKRYEFLEKN